MGAEAVERDSHTHKTSKDTLQVSKEPPGQPPGLYFMVYLNHNLTMMHRETQDPRNTVLPRSHGEALVEPPSPCGSRASVRWDAPLLSAKSNHSRVYFARNPVYVECNASASLTAVGPQSYASLKTVRVQNHSRYFLSRPALQPESSGNASSSVAARIPRR